MESFVIKTARFELRPAVEAHFGDLKRILANPEIVKMLLGDVSTPAGIEKEARKWIDDEAYWAEHRCGSWAIIDRNGAFGPANGILGVAAASPSPSGSSEGKEIFYFVRENCWGRGVAYEAAAAMIDHLFYKAGVPAIEASIFAEINPGSVRLAQKLGLTPAGRIALRDHGLDDERLQEIVTFDLWRIRNADPEGFPQVLSEAAFRIGQTIAEDYGSVALRVQELLEAADAFKGCSSDPTDSLAEAIERRVTQGAESPGLALFRAVRPGAS